MISKLALILNIPETLARYLIKISLLTLVFNIILNVCIFTYDMNTEVQKTKNYINSNVDEFGINFQYICDISNCQELSFNNNIYFKADEETGIIKKIVKLEEEKINYTNKSFDFTFPFSLAIPIDVVEGTDVNSVVVVKSVQGKMIFYIGMFVSLAMGIVILISTIIFYIHKQEQDFYTIAGDYEKSMSDNVITNYISENIHHELMTPMKTIATKVRVLGREVNKLEDPSFGCGNCIFVDDLPKYEKLFEYLTLSIDQVYSVLENMKKTKYLRQSKEHSTIYDIATHSSNLVQVINPTHFDFFIDDDFMMYELDNMSHGTLINIFINHIKNSIEAMSDTINLEFVSVSGKLLTMRLIDDGNGIPKEIVDLVFDNDVSSKDASSEARGNGLFLNREIIRRYGGDIHIFETSEMGTSFDITVPIRKK